MIKLAKNFSVTSIKIKTTHASKISNFTYLLWNNYLRNKEENFEDFGIWFAMIRWRINDESTIVGEIFNKPCAFKVDESTDKSGKEQPLRLCMVHLQIEDNKSVFILHKFWVYNWGEHIWCDDIVFKFIKIIMWSMCWYFYWRRNIYDEIG